MSNLYMYYYYPLDGKICWSLTQFENIGYKVSFMLSVLYELETANITAETILPSHVLI